MKKVLFIIWTFSMGGGAEKVLSEIVNGLDSNKYEISILEYKKFNIKEEKIPSNVKLLKPIVKEYDGNNKFKRLTSKIYEKIILFLIKYVPFTIREKFIKDKFDIEISFNYLIPTFLLSKNKNIRKIAWVHGEISDLDYTKAIGVKEKLRAFSNYFNQKKSFKNVDKIIAISEKTYNSIQTLFHSTLDKTDIIYNGFDFIEIQKKSREFSSKYNFDYPTIISLGRMDSNKNQRLLLEAAQKLVEKGFLFKLIFIGDGVERDCLKEYAKSLGLDDYIIWHGYEINPYPYIKSADILCITSYAEGFPTVAVEALYLETALVSTDVAGIKEITNDYKYCEIASFSAEDYSKSLTKALKKLKDSNELRKDARKYVERFSIEKQIEKIDNLFF